VQVEILEVLFVVLVQGGLFHERFVVDALFRQAIILLDSGELLLSHD